MSQCPSEIQPATAYHRLELDFEPCNPYSSDHLPQKRAEPAP